MTDYTKNLKPIKLNGFFCHEWDKALEPNDKICVCPDCGAVVCEECVKTGRFEKHECPDDDEDFE